MNLILQKYLQLTIEQALSMMRSEGLIDQIGLKKVNDMLREALR